MIRVIVILAGASLGVVAGCSTPRPLDATMITDPRWRTVIDTYAATVNAMRSDPMWHHHWLGNATVINQGSPHKGLCWQWRDHLDVALGPALQSSRLEARGIHARRGTRMEHNALLIFDPAAIGEGSIHSAPAPTAESPPVALVFDPWFTGEPSIYSIPEWSRLSFDAHPVGIDTRPFPVGQLAPPVKREKIHP